MHFTTGVLYLQPVAFCNYVKIIKLNNKMEHQTNIRKLKIFLRIWAALCLIIMTINWMAFIFKIQAFNPGGQFNWLIWDDTHGHVGPMIFVIYIVWSIYLFKAANDPIRYRTFLDFTLWSNIAHAAVMMPMAFNNSMYHSKFLTDIPFILLLSIGIYIWRPSSERIETINI